MSLSIPIQEDQSGNQPRFSSQTSSNSSSDNKNGSYCTSWWMSILLGLLVALLLVLLLINEVHKPTFQVDSIVVSPLNISSNNQITANWTIRLTVKNSDKQNYVVYEKFDVSVFYNGTQYLCNTTVESFRQGPKKQKALILEPKAWLQGVGKSVGEAIAAVRKRGFVKFNLKFRVDSRYSGGRQRRVIFDVHCSKLKVGFSLDGGNGTMIGGSKKCLVEGMPVTH